MKATAKDLRFHTKELLDAVERGETVTITRHGVPKAKLSPIKNSEDRDHKLFGIWHDHSRMEDVEAYINSLRRPRNVN